MQLNKILSYFRKSIAALLVLSICIGMAAVLGLAEPALARSLPTRGDLESETTLFLGCARDSSRSVASVEGALANAGMAASDAVREGRNLATIIRNVDYVVGPDGTAYTSRQFLRSHGRAIGRAAVRGTGKGLLFEASARTGWCYGQESDSRVMNAIQELGSSTGDASRRARDKVLDAVDDARDAGSRIRDGIRDRLPF